MGRIVGKIVRMIFETSNAKLKQNLNPRRFGIHAQRAHIFGAPQSGKTSIALNYAKNFKNPLYIDCADLRNTPELIKQKLLKVAFEKKIDLLILDNVVAEITAPKGINAITISQQRDLRILQNIEILPLNFEEFISFDTQGLNLKELFERFIKFGNLPAMMNLRDWQKFEAKQKMLVSAIRENMDIFLALTHFQANPMSVFQLYNILKKGAKMSKDRIYSVVDEFEGRGIVRFVAHCDKPKVPKKVFLFDFSLRNALSYERNFMASFENMVFLDLLGRESSANQREGESLERESSLQKKGAEIFYSDKIPLICGKNGYIVMPFKSKEMIADLLKGVDFMGLEIAVLTIDLNDEIVICGKKIPLISFINFALD